MACWTRASVQAGSTHAKSINLFVLQMSCNDCWQCMSSENLQQVCVCMYVCVLGVHLSGAWFAVGQQNMLVRVVCVCVCELMSGEVRGYM